MIGIEIDTERCNYSAARVERMKVRTTLALDDDLLEKAQAYTGLREKSALMREALRALIERESARRLARLGGSEPDLVAAPRRRPNPE
jgi:Arc/MetJ family transcription regulator